MIDINPKEIDYILRRVAAEKIIPHFNNLQDGDVETKTDHSPVTIADKKAEAALTEHLMAALPGSVVVGEEAVEENPQVLERLCADKPVWVIDPIDGTRNFEKGYSRFGMLLALVHNGETQYGWAYDVLGNRMAYAQRGGGAFMDGVRLRLSQPDKKPEDMTGAVGGMPMPQISTLLPSIRRVFNDRCSLHHYLDFLTGRLDFIAMTGKVTPWDNAAGALIAQEAGAHIARNDGTSYDPRKIHLHREELGRKFYIVARSPAQWDAIRQQAPQPSTSSTRTLTA